MKSDRWRLVSPHLDQALDLSGEARQGYVAALAREEPTLAMDLERLLGEERALRDEAYLEHDAQDLLAASPLVGQPFGAYTLVRSIGAGGMGSVWLARRNDGRFEGTVAVKLLSAALLGAAGAARFRREGTILARLKHPNIAQLIDAGVSEVGQPYLVLEYVEGEPIDRWCDEQGLDVRSRVRLFLDVLAAVAHAHANLVVHRDLKPSNVMVSKDGRVKLLDFGIAKLMEEDGALTQLTREGVRAFTPAFAAPEQVMGESVTTATDVYALGALLYFLLSGRHPAGEPGSSPVGLMRAILETEPQRLSEAIEEPRLRRELRGDLEVIVAMALKKRPEERYASVTALAEDLRRYLAEEPILARGDSLIYSTRKFTRRHARSLTASALAVFVLAAIVAFYTIRLRHEARKATAVSGFLTELLSQADPYVTGHKEPTVRSLLDAGALKVRKNLADQPEVQREMLALLGRIYLRRGTYDKALPMLEQAVALGRRTVGPGRELAESLSDLGVARRQGSDLAAARAALESALAMRRKTLGDADPDVAISHSELGRVLSDLGLLDEAETHYRAALAIRRKVLGPADHETATSLSDLGLLLKKKGDQSGAETLLREALERTRKSSGPRHPDVGTSLSNLALVIEDRGDHRTAEAMLRESLEIGQASLGREHPRNAQKLANLAIVLRAEGRLAEAEAADEEALAISRRALGMDHPTVAQQEVILARIHLDQGRPATAAPLLRHALEAQRRRLPKGDWRIGETLSLLGDASTRLARFAEAEPCLLQALEILEAHSADRPVRRVREARDNRARLAALYAVWGRPQPRPFS
ncbi:MAG: tetratricopeptide repeat protein [Thermoanaerobaculia bacterium]